MIKFVKTFYITTTIPYANASPHIGFALEIVQADVLARWHRQLGHDVFFLTGTDEHGTKIYQTAKSAKQSVKKFVDKNTNEFKKLTKILNISNDNFIRTTDKKKHWPGVVKLWKILEKKGDIYKQKYTGYYCSGCERFVTAKDLVGGQCQTHPNVKIEKISEENYFFKLSKYSNKIKNLIKTGKLDIYPKTYRNDFLALIKPDLQDVSFSRDKKHLPWGIPVPGDKSQVMYVWCDALTNYLTGIGFPNTKYKKYWPANIHIAGKDMLRFHAGIWPGMLLSAGLPLPKQIAVHGFITSEGKKMSKSLGNIIDPFKEVEKYGADSVRYFLLREIPFGEDGDFSEKSLIERNNGELANKLGNLVSRVATLAEKYGIQKKTRNQSLSPKWKKALCNNKVEYEEIIAGINSNKDIIRTLKIKQKAGYDALLLSNLQSMNEVTQKFVKDYIESFQFDKALNLIFAFVDACNEFIQIRKPWEDSKSVKYKRWVLGETVRALKEIAILLEPFIPESAEKIKKQFSAKKIKKGKILFKKIDLDKAEEPFEKLDLRVAKIIEVKDIKKADKLYKIKIDAGPYGKKQIIAGIKQYYNKSKLKNKKIVVIANLKPAKLRGELSEGMLLAAEKGNKVGLLIAPGSEVGDRVFPHGILPKPAKQISFEDFLKIKMKAKHGNAFYKNKILQTIHEEIEIEKIKDAASIR